MSFSGQIIVISAASGTGKTSLVKALMAQMPELQLSISHTTRPRRVNEENGKHYWFVSESEFFNQISENQFLEYAKVFDHYYGTSRHWLESQLQNGKEVILEIDWQGAKAVRAYYPKAVLIFIFPPSLKTLRTRLYQRGQDSEGIIEKRLKEAAHEMLHAEEFDYWIMNDVFEKALEDLSKIIQTNRLQKDRQIASSPHLIQTLLHT